MITITNDNSMLNNFVKRIQSENNLREVIYEGLQKLAFNISYSKSKDFFVLESVFDNTDNYFNYYYNVTSAFNIGNITNSEGIIGIEELIYNDIIKQYHKYIENYDKLMNYKCDSRSELIEVNRGINGKLLDPRDIHNDIMYRLLKERILEYSIDIRYLKDYISDKITDIYEFRSLEYGYFSGTINSDIMSDLFQEGIILHHKRLLQKCIKQQDLKNLMYLYREDENKYNRRVVYIMKKIHRIPIDMDPDMFLEVDLHLEDIDYELLRDKNKLKKLKSVQFIDENLLLDFLLNIPKSWLDKNNNFYIESKKKHKLIEKIKNNTINLEITDPTELLFKINLINEI